MKVRRLGHWLSRKMREWKDSRLQPTYQGSGQVTKVVPFGHCRGKAILGGDCWDPHVEIFKHSWVYKLAA